MAKSKSKAIVDDKLYTVVSHGARFGPFTYEKAVMEAHKTRDEWAALGFNGGRGRKAEVYYRDGSVVLTVLPHPVD